MNIKWEKNELSVEAKGSIVKVPFDWPIVTVLEYDATLFVLLTPPIKSCINENVFGVDSNGKLLWTIAKIPHLYDDSPYTGIESTSDGVVAHNWDGKSVLLNPRDGNVVRSLQSK
jgi:hypothetical protein